MAHSINRREFYRLSYPNSDRPLIRFGKKVLPVAEISEEGVKIAHDGQCPALDEPFRGTIIFQDGEQATVEGVVYRLDDRDFVVKLTQGISIRRITLEQLWLKEKFPILFETKK